VSAVTDGLLLVLSQPGAVPEGDFHAWYDEEHAPARVAFPEIRNATRWRAADGAEPGWMATYDIELSVLDRPDYRALREHRSDREQAVIAGLDHFERRTYRLVDGDPDAAPGPLTVAVSLDVPDARAGELAAWYAEEHAPALLAIPGWLRVRRYELLDGDAPRWLAVHDLAGPEPFDTPAYAAATSTPWRAEVMAAVTRRERRVFAVHRRF
jgi:hypothetical protein